MKNDLQVDVDLSMKNDLFIVSAQWEGCQLVEQFD